MSNCLSSQTMSNTPLYSFVNKKLWARVLSVHDGDTLTAAIEAFPGCFFRYNIRLDGIDASEITSHDERLKVLAVKSRNRLLHHVSEGKITLDMNKHFTRNDIIKELANDVYLVFLHCREMDKYGRILAQVYKNDLPEGPKSINELILEEGYAIKYDGGAKRTELF